MKLLLVEDEKGLAQSIQEYLTGKEFVCEWVDDFNSARNKISIYEYDCIILDLMLPDGNGLDLLRELKKRNKSEGIIIISAKETLETRLEGLRIGADDFLIKPFHLSELLVRVQSIIRRKQFNGTNSVEFRELKIDILSKKASVNGNQLELTKSEFDLLLLMIGNKNRVLSRSSIAEHLSGDMADMMDNHNFVYAHIKNLKKKLKEAGSHDYIKTVYGLGYQWNET